MIATRHSWRPALAAALTLAMPALASAAPAVEEDIRDLRGPILPSPSQPWWPYLVIAIAALAVAVGVRIYLRRRRTPLPPAARALRDLEAARALIERGDAHGFSSRVSDAVRSYVEDAFSIHAPRRTTDELLADLMTGASPVAAHRQTLGTFLGYCDLAKYARWSLSPTDMAGMLDSAAAFVRATDQPAPMPSPTPATPAQAPS